MTLPNGKGGDVIIKILTNLQHGREKRRWPVIKLKYTLPGWYFALYSSQTSKLYIYLKKKNTTQIPRSFIIQIIETASDSVEKVNECMLSGNEMIQHNETIKVKGKNGKKKTTNGH